MSLLVAPAATPLLQPQLVRSGRCRHQKGTLRIRRGQRRRQCEGVDNNDGGHADFADAELVDDAGDVAAAVIARDLTRGAAIPAGEEGGRGGGGGSAGTSSWLLRCLMSCRRCLLSSWRSAASCPLVPPLLFASCAPTLPLPYAFCLPAGCRIAPVVAPPPTSPHDIALTSSLPSGCRNLQRPTCRSLPSSRLQLSPSAIVAL